MLSASDDFCIFRVTSFPLIVFSPERGHKTLYGHINEKDLNSILEN